MTCPTPAPAASTEDLQGSSNLKPYAQLQATLERLLNVMEQLMNRLEPPPEILSIQRAAELTGLSDKHIRRAVKRGELPCSNLGGEQRPTLRIFRRDIDAWMEAKRLKHAPARSERDALVDKYFGKPKKRPGAAA